MTGCGQLGYQGSFLKKSKNYWTSTNFSIIFYQLIYQINDRPTWVPVFPRRLQTYRPRNPVLPKTVHTIPLNELRPPVPRLSDTVVGFLMILNSDDSEYLHDCWCWTRTGPAEQTAVAVTK